MQRKAQGLAHKQPLSIAKFGNRAAPASLASVPASAGGPAHTSTVRSDRRQDPTIYICSSKHIFSVFVKIRTNGNLPKMTGGV